MSISIETIDMNSRNLSISHLAWCALIALHLARADGLVTTPAQENLFLTRWLALAQKQRRFPRELAGDLQWLLNEGRTKGIKADLPGKFAYLWEAGSGDTIKQNDLFRLQHVLHMAVLQGWTYKIFDEKQWSGRRRERIDPNKLGLYLLKQSLHTCFDSDGQQTHPLLAKLGGGESACSKLNVIFLESGWTCCQDEITGYYFLHVSLLSSKSRQLT